MSPGFNLPAVCLAVGLCLTALGASAETDALVVHGFDPEILELEPANVGKYRSSIDFPPVIGWDGKGKSLLFNGGQQIYGMRRHDGKLRVHSKLKRSLSPYLSPDRKKFIWMEDVEGDENFQLHLYDLRSKRSTPLTEAGSRAYDPYWSPDSRFIAFKSNTRVATEADLWIADVTRPDHRRLLMRNVTDDGLVYDWDNAGRMLVVRIVSENDKELFLVDTKDGTNRRINPSSQEIAYSDARFLADGKRCLIVSDEYGEFLNLMLYDLETTSLRNLTAELSWDVDQLVVFPDDEHVVFAANADGTSELYRLELATGRYSRAASIPRGVVRNLVAHPNGGEVAFNLYGTTFRKKVFSLEVETGTLRRWTPRGTTRSDAVTYAEPQAFRYPSRDSKTGSVLEIPAFIHRPPTPAKTGHPVFIEIHGGPEYQQRPTFNSHHQYLVHELGIAVIVPNVRGSMGYGKSYLRADDSVNRGNAIDDVGALLDWVAEQPDLDASRVAIFGESYGGYAVLASLVRFSDRIRCGIDVVGISNWIEYLSNTAGYRRDLRRVEFGDERIPEVREFLRSDSPFTDAENIRSPLFLVHGRNDPRVHYRESEQIFNRLQQQGNTVWYLLANNEGHGFQRPENYTRQRNAQIEFLKRYLLDGAE